LQDTLIYSTGGSGSGSGSGWHWWVLFGKVIYMFEYCRKSNKRKKKEVPYSSQYHEELDGEEPVVYEEVGTFLRLDLFH
jgi:hypothetical protein